MNESEKNFLDEHMELLKDMIEYFSLACYFLKKDTELTILYGNDAFYALLQQSRDDVRYK